MKRFHKLLFLASIEKHVIPGPEEDDIHGHSNEISFRVVNRIWALEFAFWFHHITSCVILGKEFNLFAPQFLNGIMILNTVFGDDKKHYLIALVNSRPSVDVASPPF